MRSFVYRVLLFLTFIFAVANVNAKRKFDGDFEFAEEDDTKILKIGDKKLWIHDPNSELCRPLNCKKKELCLLEDTFTAVCVSKKELYKSGDIVIPKSRTNQKRRLHTDTSIESGNDDAFFDSEDDDEDQDESRCHECPVTRPNFLCGIDNRTYSSPCRLEYHNCIHHTSIHVACKGFCPCKNDLNLRLYTKKALKSKLQNSISEKSTRNKDITLTPRDFNYDNHHYQYLKYGKRLKDFATNNYNEHAKHPLNNEMLRKSTTMKTPVDSTESRLNPVKSNDCSAASKTTMANRLLDWFSVVMSDSKYRRQHTRTKGYFPSTCQIEVKWMFGHLDIDGDRKISLSELYGLEHDQNEPCLKPFIDTCDTNSDNFINSLEWCGCFSKAERPCAAVRRRSPPDVAPVCDSRGYYKNIQCHRGLGLCWCVDSHGVEFSGTRTRQTKPDCDAIIRKLANNGLKTNSVELPHDESSNDDEDSEGDNGNDIEGSADQPLDF